MATMGRVVRRVVAAGGFLTGGLGMARAGSFLAIAFAVLAGACQSTTQAKETSSGGASAAQTTGVAPGATTTGTAGAGTGTASSTSTGGGISTSGGTLIGSVTTLKPDRWWRRSAGRAAGATRCEKGSPRAAWPPDSGEDGRRWRRLFRRHTAGATAARG